MGDASVLTQEEEQRCREALHLLGIRSADHPILRNRGYFALYLSGLSAQEIGDGDGAHPSVQEFRQLQRLLAKAGVERLKSILAEPTSGGGCCAPPGGALIAPGQVAPHLVKPDAPRSKFSGIRGIEPVRPGPEARDRRRTLPRPEDGQKARELAQELLASGHYHDAYSICAEYLVAHGMDESMFEMAAAIIQLATQYDRDQARAPFNMLFECEELAHIIARHIPDMTVLGERADEYTTRMYRMVSLVYSTWTNHACGLIEYRFKSRNDAYILRNWVEPREIGFLRDIMLIGVRSKLPLDLLRVIYNGCRACIERVKNVIPFENKKAKFEGDALRIIASPVKDVVPDMQLEIYKDLIKAYMLEGDTATANTFVQQGLLIRKKDKDLLEMQEKIRMLIAQGSKSGEHPKLGRS